MARFRKTLYLVVEGCMLVTLSVTAGVLVLHENVFRQLPLYCFLEEKAQESSARQDRETYEKLMESNARYLGRMVVNENKEVGSKENDKEIADKQVAHEQDAEKDGKQGRNMLTPTEKVEITATPVLEKTEPEQKTSEQKKAEQSEYTDRQEDAARKKETEMAGEEEVSAAAAQVQPMPEIDLAPEKLADYDYLMNHFFILDSNTEISAQQLNAATLLGEDLTIPKEETEPQILIYHSHSQETFADSSPEDMEIPILYLFLLKVLFVPLHLYLLSVYHQQLRFPQPAPWKVPAYVHFDLSQSQFQEEPRLQRSIGSTAWIFSCRVHFACCSLSSLPVWIYIYTAINFTLSSLSLPPTKV